MRDFKTPQDFEWKSRPGSASQTAALFGDPAKPGLYIQLLKRGPDDWSQPHSHANERFITVIAGTFKIGTGDKLDKERTVSLGPGSVVRDIANQMHYDGTGPEGATIQIMGMGPTTRN
jgi:redox-sensitive bicupin YhaK (pirin superfamily)